MYRRYLVIGFIFFSFCISFISRAEQINQSFDGDWVVNDGLSDDTDKQVEKAIKKAGGRPDSGGKKGKGRYRGGPEDQELYEVRSARKTLR